MVKRPLLPAEDRNRLLVLAKKAAETGAQHNRAYAQGVVDTLLWIAGNNDMSPLLEEVTR